MKSFVLAKSFCLDNIFRCKLFDEKQTESYVVMMQKRRGLLRNITQPSMFAVFLVVTKVFDI